MTGGVPIDTPATARRLHLDDVRSDQLRDFLARWRSRSGADGIYRLDRDGSVGDLHEAGLLGPLNAMVAVTGAHPESWVVSFAGATVNAYCGQPSLIGYRFVDLPLKGLTVTSLTTIAEVLPERRIAAHRICGYVPGQTVIYERLVLPVANRDGVVNRFVTRSQFVVADRGESLSL